MRKTTLTDLFVSILILTAAAALLLILQDEAPATITIAEPTQQVSTMRFAVTEKSAASAPVNDYADRFSGLFDIDSVTDGNCEALAKQAYDAYRGAPTSCDRNTLFSKYGRIKDRCEELNK